MPDEDAEFGDFGAAATSTITDDNPNALPESIDSQTSACNEDDDAEFGDFGVAPTSTNMADTPNDVPESMDSEMPDEDAEFGDFGEAPRDKNTADSHKGPVFDDDDLEDFGEKATDKNKSENFQVAPDCTDYRRASFYDDDDDEFGDFGEATTDETKVDTHKSGTCKQGDDEDDKFGDLGKASSLVVHKSVVSAEGDEFGEFSSLDVVDVTQPTLASTPAEVNEHPLLEKAKRVCSNIFAQNLNAEDSEKDDVEESAWTHTVSITEVLVSTTGLGAHENVDLTHLFRTLFGRLHS